MNLAGLTLRYLKGQKKHTFTTILSVTVSVAFLTVLLCVLSIYRGSAVALAEKNSGSYHVLFNSLTKEQLLTIKNMDIFSQTENYSLSSYMSRTDLDYDQMENENAHVEYLVREGQLVDDLFFRINTDAAQMMPDYIKECIEGRLPERDGEIALSTASTYMWGYPSIGDTVTANLVTCSVKKGEGIEDSTVPSSLTDAFDIDSNVEISFTVVGFTSQYNVVSYDDTRLKAYSNQFDSLLCRYADNVNSLYWAMHYAFADQGLEIDDFDYTMNDNLLDAEGKGLDAQYSQALFFSVAYLCIIFIMFCIRLVIDDSFEISAKERIKQFGLLKAVGASRKQIFAMLMYESLYLSVPGIILGMIAGTALAYAGFGIIKGIIASIGATVFTRLSTALTFTIKPFVYISAAVLGFIWVATSAISTGMRSIRSTPVQALSAAGKNEKVRVPGKPTKIMKGGSFIGAYSSVSVTRNMKRFVITILSMVLSIVLFAGFSYGLDLMRQTIDSNSLTDNVDYDFVINYQTYFPQETKQREQELRDSGLFSYVQCHTSMALFSEELSDYGITQEELGSDMAAISVAPANRDTFENCITTDVSYDEFVSSGGILLCKDLYDTDMKTVVASLYSEGVPESIKASPYMYVTGDLFDEVTIPALGTYTTDCTDYRSSASIICAVVSEEKYEELFESDGRLDNYTSLIPSDSGDGYELFYQRDINLKVIPGCEDEAVRYLDIHHQNQYIDYLGITSFYEGLLKIVTIAGYFVIAIITAIAVINIANIISANVQSRSSEFAMLRACGLSDRQLRGLLLRESLIYAGLSGAISLVLMEVSILVIQLPYILHWEDLYLDDLPFEFSYTAPVKYLIIAIAVGFVISALASLAPARKLIRESIVENVRGMENPV